MATESEFANVNGSLEQFASSAAQSAALAAYRGAPQLLLLKPSGEAETSYDPVWLLREDAAQGSEGKSGFTFWDPHVDPEDRRNGGKRTSLVVEAYDLAERRGLQLRVPMETSRKNPFMRSVVKGVPQPHGEISVLAASTPRYAEWNLDTFVNYAEHELVRGAARAQRRGKYRGDDRIPAQDYPQIDEFAGFASIDGERIRRMAYSRSGARWFGKAMSDEWKPGEQAAKGQLLRSLRDNTKSESSQPEFAGVWWTATGVLQSRFLDLSGGEALAGQWRIEPANGAKGFFATALSVGDNTVTRIAQNAKVEYGW